jgi:hypothetical protein
VGFLDELPAVDDAEVVDLGAAVLDRALEPHHVAEEVVEHDPIEPDGLVVAVRLVLEPDDVVVADGPAIDRLEVLAERQFIIFGLFKDAKRPLQVGGPQKSDSSKVTPSSVRSLW